MGDALPVTLWLWAAAVSPVLLLFAIVARGRLNPRVGAATALVATVLVAAVVFRMSAGGIAVGIGKGAWLALWILLVVWPALLLYRIVAAVGFERVGDALSALLPTRPARLLVVAWLFPSFVQGVAGFGTPIAVAAPLLVAMGWSATRAVALALIGYQWSVTFGSMGSSFYVASLTAGFDHGGQVELALRSGAFLGANCLVAGALVLLMDGGWQRLREGWGMLLRIGVPMALTLVAVAAVVPAVASLMAATVGFAVLWVTVLRRTRQPAVAPVPVAASGSPELYVARPESPESPTRSDRSPSPLVLLCPYVFLLVTALPVFLVPWSREWIREHVRFGPTFPSTDTGRGWVEPRVDSFNPVALFGHPGFYLLLACVLGFLAYRRFGLLESAQVPGIVRDWARGLPAASVVIGCLTSVAMVMSDAGMISELAGGTASITGSFFPVLSPFVGAVGSFMTGSTTSSNALLAAFQSEVAGLLDIDPQTLVAAQTAGANAGNALAPVVVLIGLSAVGAPGRMSAVLRLCLWPTLVLLGTIVVAVLVSLLIS